MRCFVAVDVSADVRGALARVQAELCRAAPRADVRWVEAEKIHLTLQFLGAVADERVPRVAAAVESVARRFGPLSLEARGLGGFPSARRPRVVWAGVEGDVAGLAAVARACGEALAPLGFPPEDRAFRAHLTLGRVRSPRALGELAGAIGGADATSLGGWTVGDVVLYQSRLRPTGELYEAVTRAPFHGA